MNNIHTARFSLPLLAAGQAHKELYHNEALTLLDFLLQPVVVGVENDPEALSPSEGQCWLIGNTPLSDWTTKPDQLACWSNGGWRYIQPLENMRVYVTGDESFTIYRNGVWEMNDSISEPAGGQIVDVEARAAIESILGVLRKAGLIPI